jgi:hypothetical protein
MSNEVIEAQMLPEKQPATMFDDEGLIIMARKAEAMIEAVKKIKQVSLAVTNAKDWTDQQGNPYLQASGAEKVGNLWNISWRFLTPEPIFEEDPDGHYTFTYQGEFSMPNGRTIQAEGSRSSRDPFFKQNLYENGKFIKEKTIQERDNKRDVKMAALTNLLGNGITRILGIRNLTWEDLEKFALIKQEEVRKIQYKEKGESKAPIREPQKKGEGGQAAENVSVSIKSIFHKDGTTKDGKNFTKHTIVGADDVSYNTFSATIAEDAQKAKESGAKVKIGFNVGKFGKDIVTLEIDVPEDAP